MGYIIRELYEGRRPTLHSDGKQRRDFVYVDDLIDLALLVRANEGFDIVNVSTEKTYSINEITTFIAKQMNLENLDPQYRETAHFWANYPELYEGPYPINPDLLEHEVLKYTCLSTKHAYDNYGWSPKTDIEEGIKKTVDFTLKKLKNR